jgi:phosphatidylglycerophosphatase C
MFDFDGVLVRGDSTVTFLGRLARDSGARAIRVLAPAWSFYRTSRWGPEGRVSEHAAEVIRRCLRDHQLEQVHEMLADEGHRLAMLDERRCDPALQHLHRMRDAGARPVVNTAAMEPLVRAWLDTVGLHTVPVIASSLGQSSEGVHLKHHNRGPAKVRAAASAGWGSSWAWAFTDSTSDLPMLARAQRPHLVNASRSATRVARARLKELTVLTW